MLKYLLLLGVFFHDSSLVLTNEQEFYEYEKDLKLSWFYVFKS